MNNPVYNFGFYLTANTLLLDYSFILLLLLLLLLLLFRDKTVVTLTYPRIVSIIAIDDQQDANFGLFICIQSALHVSGDVFTNHQEHLTVFTASDIIHLCCCRPATT